MTQLFIGIHYLLEGFRLISERGLRRFVVIPLFINMLLFTGLFFLLYHYTGEFNQWFEQHLPTWLTWLGLFIWLLFFLSFFLLFISAFVTVANLMSAPFNSLLAEKVEEYLTGKSLEGRTMGENIKDIPRIMGRQLGILGYYVPRTIFLLVLFFIPLIQSAASVLWFLFNAWMMTLTYLDYPTDNHRLTFQATRAWLSQRRWVAWGFGISVLLVSMIPVINFFVIPAAVAGATKFWVEEK